MPRRNHVPTYRRHKQSGQAIVTLTDALGNRRDAEAGMRERRQAPGRYREAHPVVDVRQVVGVAEAYVGEGEGGRFGAGGRQLGGLGGGSHLRRDAETVLVRGHRGAVGGEVEARVGE